MDEQRADRPDPWSTLWQASAWGSWNLMGNDAVAAALREHWRAQGPWILSSGRVLDVGSGPAVLARLLWAADAGQDGRARWPQWICVDQADIAPAATADLPQLLTVFGRPLQAVDLQGGQVAALVSNFGLEYVPAVHRARCCAAWLQRGGRLHTVLHASGSAIDRRCEAMLADLALALTTLEFPKRLIRLLRAKVSAPQDAMARMMHAVDVRDDFNEAVNLMKAQLEARGDRQGPLFEMLVIGRDAIQRVAAATLEEEVDRLQALQRGYEAEGSRLRAMRSAALDGDSLSALERELAACGFERVQATALPSDEGLVGWVLDAIKA